MHPRDGRGEMARYASHGVGWVLTVLLLAWGGLALDERIGTSPLFVLLGAMLGIVGGFYRLYVRLIVEPENRNREDSGPRDAR